MNTFNDMEKAIREAEQQIELADRFTAKMARLILGRLRKVKNPWVLRALKTELRDFNMTTGEWKE